LAKNRLGRGGLWAKKHVGFAIEAKIKGWRLTGFSRTPGLGLG
jgi:hypothetical protein